MREFAGNTEAKLMRVVCNKCGRTLKVENGYLKEGCFHGKSAFGYFSRKDGVTQQFDLCEDCYDQITAEFAVPVEETGETELV